MDSNHTDQLTPEQRAAVDAFANCHRAYEEHRRTRTDALAARRTDALAAAREARVPGPVLARAAGLSHGRIYQLAADAGLQPWRWWETDDDPAE